MFVWFVFRKLPATSFKGLCFWIVNETLFSHSYKSRPGSVGYIFLFYSNISVIQVTYIITLNPKLKPKYYTLFFVCE